MFIVFLSEIELGLPNPEFTPSGLRRVPSATRLWFAAPRQEGFGAVERKCHGATVKDSKVAADDKVVVVWLGLIDHLMM